MSLPARPTTYRGIAMRSRLEATVAAHFDRWGYDWRYEARAFASSAGQYLPDFELWVNGTLRSVVEVKGERLLDPYETLDRMEIVWASEPEVHLLLIEAEALQAGWYRAKTTWPTATFPVRKPGWEGNWAGVFAMCHCGTVGLRMVGNGTIGMACRGCGDEGTAVAFLDPTEYRG